MGDLNKENEKEILSILKEFYDAVPDDDSQKDLMEKKRRARLALGHLVTIFNVEAPAGIKARACSTPKGITRS